MVNPIIRAVKDCARSKYAWPGGYPMFVVMADGEALCPSCARSEFSRVARATRERSRDGWRAEAVAINWEDPSLFCCHCSARIESAYAESEGQTNG